MIGPEPPGAIRVLPDHVIDQIAAGEVVERPASVVKELVENALDAGARRITVEVEGGGRRLIRVLDDGAGMSPDEARLALVRHATSKLSELGDLVRIQTMGFRGEALPSIASVSRMSLTTRSRRAPEQPGYRLEIEGGRVVAEEEVGAPVGTAIEVRDLLWNVPARLKFLKGEATETAHVSEAVSRLAMAHPDVHLKLVCRGRTALEAPPARDGFERVRALLGARVSSGAADRLVRAARREGAVEVEAYLGAPALAQTTARGLHFFIGRRWVRDRGLVHAVLQGYGELVPRGRYPTGAVFLALPGGEVDVNVHPQKLEVRFSDAQAVYAAVRHAVRSALAEAPFLGEPVWPSAATGRPTWPATASEQARDYASRLSRSLFAWRSAPPPGVGLGGGPVTAGSEAWGWKASESGAPESAARAGAGGQADAETGGRSALASGSVSGSGPGSGSVSGSGSGSGSVSGSGSGSVSGPVPSPGFFSSLTYLGQLELTYLVCEAPCELVLIDQHAAHERVAYEALLAGHQSRTIQRQALLFPHTVDLDRHLAAAALESQDLLRDVGFELEPFGDATGGASAFALKAVPAGIRSAEDPTGILRRMLSELSEHGGSRAIEQRIEAALATVACHSVVRAGDRLTPAEVIALLRSLDQIEFRAHCPHGRPVLLRLGTDELARRFGRL